MNMPDLPVRIAALYCFTPLADPAKLCTRLAEVCKASGIKGTLLLAVEGINGTIAGTDAGIADVLAHIRSFAGSGNLDIKESRAAALPFHRMKVRIKREIVTMGEPNIDPLKGAGHYVEPEDWNALIAEPGTILIDTRNNYEVAAGTFANAINPETQTFREFPAWFRGNRSAIEGGAKVAMFCTGGIRCEKATALLKAEGIEAVYHLKGGILKYLEMVPPEQSRWQGECFVFDERVTVTHGLGPGTLTLCRACRRPVSAEDRQSPLFVQGVSCPACYAERDDRQRAGYAERERQARLSEARGEMHVGATARCKSD